MPETQVHANIEPKDDDGDVEATFETEDHSLLDAEVIRDSDQVQAIATAESHSGGHVSAVAVATPGGGDASATIDD